MRVKWYFCKKNGDADRAETINLIWEVASLREQHDSDGEVRRILGPLTPLFDNAWDAVSLMEYRDGKYFYVRNNAAHQRLTGYRDVAGRELEELVGREIHKQVIGYYETCVASGRTVWYEQEFEFEPGRRIWQTEVSPMLVQGEVRYLLLISKDITDMKRVERENEVLNRRLRAMFDQHSVLKVVFDPETGGIVDVNPALCQYFGYSRDELVGQRVQEFNLLPPDTQEWQFRNMDSGTLFSAAPHRLKSGENRYLDAYVSSIFDGEQRLLYGILFDVTERELLRDNLTQEKELLRVTLQSIGDGVVTTDCEGRITGMNPMAEELTGWSLECVADRLFTEVFILRNEETGAPAVNPIQKVLDTGRVVGLANHTELVRPMGKPIPIADSAAPIRTKDGRSHGVVMVFRDVSAEKEHSKQVEYLSRHDGLTGLSNRRYAERALSKLNMPENLPISVIMGDVNGLKITNDVFGHQAGDMLLKDVAELLRRHCGAEDLVARWGGDEFAVFMPHTTQAQAQEIVRHIREDQLHIDGNDIQLNISLGCATKEGTEQTLQAVLREAEEHMYHQKLLEGKSYRSDIISTLLATLYEKSNETEGHSKRLELYCHAVGAKMRLDSKEMDELSLLALLHDIGKVGIDLNILRKPGALTPQEWEEMRRHPEVGYRIAQNSPELLAVADLILAHHERWDGKGYPCGLKGEAIPLHCRILAVADAFDAMTNDRAYRRAMSTEQALVEIQSNSGTQFDPAVVEVFLDIVEKGEIGREYAGALGGLI